jgi:hypothetical protein
MAKTLELNFDAEFGAAKISVKNPKEPLTPAEIKTAMDAMVQSNAFSSAKGSLVKANSARVIDRTTEDIVLP